MKEPANGLSHTWDVSTDPGNATAVFVDDLVAATTGSATYNQLTTLVAISIAERGATFRMRLAQEQSGMRYDGKNAVDLEIERGVIALTKLNQKAAFQGEKGTGAKTGTDEFGTYYQFGYDGFRGMLGNVSGMSAYYPNSGTNIAVDQGTNTLEYSQNIVGQQIADAGGDLSNYSVWMNYATYSKYSREAGNLLRTDQANANGISYGVNISNLLLGGVSIPVYVVPGDSIGSYIPSAGFYAGTTGCYDMYFLDRSQVSYAHLGPETPFVIEIPAGVDGTLTNRYLIAWIASMVVKAPALNGKMRVGI